MRLEQLARCARRGCVEPAPLPSRSPSHPVRQIRRDIIACDAAVASAAANACRVEAVLGQQLAHDRRKSILRATGR